MHMLDGLAGPACGIRQCLQIVNLWLLNDPIRLTRFMAMPPSEWQTKMIGRCIASSSYLLYLSDHSWLHSAH
jgi:hypothetical protein